MNNQLLTSLNPKILVLHLCNANTSVETNAWKQHEEWMLILAGKYLSFLNTIQRPNYESNRNQMQPAVYSQTTLNAPDLLRGGQEGAIYPYTDATPCLMSRCLKLQLFIINPHMHVSKFSHNSLLMFLIQLSPITSIYHPGIFFFSAPNVFCKGK